MILANVLNCHNKINEIVRRIDDFCHYLDCHVYCFTETWLTPDYPDIALHLLYLLFIGTTEIVILLGSPGDVACSF